MPRYSPRAQTRVKRAKSNAKSAFCLGNRLIKYEMPPKKKRRVESDKPTKETKQGKIWQFLSTRQYGTPIVNESGFIVAVKSC